MRRGRAARAVTLLALAILLADVALLVQRRPADPHAGPAPAPSASPAESVEEQLARVATLVEAIRDLTFPAPPRATYLPPEELAARVRELADEYTAEQADTDLRLLRTLGAVPPDYDLRGGLSDLLSEQVAGFYDPETGELVVGVRERDRRLTPLEEVFLAHELQHALADATLGLPPDPEGELVEDRALAGAALIEGDASLTMQEYVTVGFNALDQLRFAGESLGTLGQLEALEAVPWVLRRTLEFPYLEGLAFVSRLRERGGWPAVDAAYRNPPSTTGQILFPERYTATAQPPPPPPPSGDLAAPWQRRTRVAVGAADLLFLFEAPGDDPAAALDDPRGHVGALGAGAATLWVDGPRDALGLVLTERGPAGALCESVAAWYLRAFPTVEPRALGRAEVLAVDGPRQDAVVRCEEGVVRVGIGPDLATARAAA